MPSIEGPYQPANPDRPPPYNPDYTGYSFSQTHVDLPVGSYPSLADTSPLADPAPCSIGTGGETNAFFNKINESVEKYFPTPLPPSRRSSRGFSLFGERSINFIGFPSFGWGRSHSVRGSDDRRDSALFLACVLNLIVLPFATFFGGRAIAKLQDSKKVLKRIDRFKRTNPNLPAAEQGITNRAERLFTQIKKREAVKLATLITIAVSSIFVVIGFLAAAEGVVVLGCTGALIGGAVLLVRKGMEWHDNPAKRRAEKLKQQLNPYIATSHI